MQGYLLSGLACVYIYMIEVRTYVYAGTELIRYMQTISKFHFQIPHIYICISIYVYVLYVQDRPHPPTYKHTYARKYMHILFKLHIQSNLINM